MTENPLSFCKDFVLEGSPCFFDINGKSSRAFAQNTSCAVDYIGPDVCEIKMDIADRTDIDGVYPLDITFLADRKALRVLHAKGGISKWDAFERDFQISDSRFKDMQLSSRGGRSSNNDLPAFIVHDERENRGIFVFFGWSGDWRATLFTGTGNRPSLRLEAPVLHHPLHNSDHINVSCLVGYYEGPIHVGWNKLRRVLYEEYMPNVNGEKPLPPVSWNHWFSLWNEIDEDKLIRQADICAEIGIEYFCIDAGWFTGGFADGVGNWEIDKTKFPRELSPVFDYVRKRGMRCGLWFEPERAMPDTNFANSHPDWVCDNLVDFSNPEVCNWAYEMMAGYISSLGIEWIRWDMNMDSAPVWQKLDSQDASQTHEIGHISGLHEIWSRLIDEFPGLLIEGCASGGRRIDLSTIRRSHTFWKSDHTGDTLRMRYHATGANHFLPGGLLNTNLLEFADAFDIRSMFAGPLGFGTDWSNAPREKIETARREIALYKSIRKYINCDYYPLFDQSHTGENWCGWQFHDPASESGFALVLRPETSPYASAKVSLKGLSQVYTDVDTGNPVSPDRPLELDKRETRLVIYSRD